MTVRLAEKSTAQAPAEAAVPEWLPARLRAAGMKPTPNLLAVLGGLAQAGDAWLSGEDLYRRMVLGGTPLGLATIYRLLKLLVLAGVVARTWQGNCGSVRTAYRYRTPSELGGQLRLRCNPGGRWVPIEDPALRDDLLQVLRQHGLAHGSSWELEMDGVAVNAAADNEGELQC